jgi:2-aminoethylphosphonate-pyruvate transaminase
MILLNPGPVNVSPRVTAALARGDICHREPECEELLARIRTRLLQAFAPAGGFEAVLVSGSGTAAVEMAVTSVLSRRGRLVIAANGVYGERMAAIAEASGSAHTVVAGDWLAPPDPAAVERGLAAPDVEALALVHHETTTGLLNPVRVFGELARRHGKLFLVDAVSGLAGDPLDLEADGVDLVAGTAGKCIQGFPGMAFVLVRSSVLARLAEYPRRSLYLSLPTYVQNPMPFTPAVQLAYAFDEALAELLEEGVDTRIARYGVAAALLRYGFARLGLECVLPPELRSSTITSLRFPPGLDYPTLHDALRARGFVIYEGQGPLARDLFRVANMGHLAAADFTRFLAALGEVLDA